MLAQQVEGPRGHEVDAVVARHRGRGRASSRRVLPGHEAAVEAVAERERREHQRGEDGQAHGDDVIAASWWRQARGGGAGKMGPDRARRPRGVAILDSRVGFSRKEVSWPRESKQRSRSGGRKYGDKAQEKVEKVMRERKRGTLRSGRSGKKVTSRKQAIAIGLSEARRAGAKVPRGRSRRGGRKK